MNNNHSISAQQLLDRLNWRYATKQFDPTRKINAQDWATLEDALLLTPSSGGLQPWKFIVVTDPAVRAKLLPASYGQSKITNASHLVVFAAKKSFSEADVDAFINHTAATRGVSVESLVPFRDMLVGGIVKSLDEAARDAWGRNQAYIALGNLLTSAAVLGIDACPMEGFNRAQYDEVLGLNKQGFASAVIATLGYPGCSITLRGNPEFAAAYQKWMEAHRPGGGFIVARGMAMWARLERGDQVAKCIEAYMGRGPAPNLHNAGANQSDASYGFTAAVAEALVQSHAGEISLLPALPAGWDDGSVSGLRARGGYDVSLQWKGGKLQAADLHSIKGGPIKVRYGQKTATLTVKPGEAVHLNAELAAGK